MAQSPAHTGHRRRDIAGIGKGLTGPADAVGNFPKGAGLAHLPPAVAHQTFVQFLDQLEIDRHSGIQPLQSVFQSVDIADYLLRVGSRGFVGRFRLEKQQLLQVGGGAFDAAGQHRFPADKGADKQVGIGQHLPDAVQFAQGPVRGREIVDGRQVQGQGRRQRVGDKGKVFPQDTVPAPNQLPGKITDKIRGLHAETPL